MARRSPRKRRITLRSAPRRSRCDWISSVDNTRILADDLEQHPRIARVYYPGLESHPQYELAKRCSAIRARCLALSWPEIDVFDFLNRLDVVIKSSNLGDNRTLAIPVAHTIYFEMGAERRATMGIADSLIRISVGIEDIGRPDRRFRQRARKLFRNELRHEERKLMSRLNERSQSLPAAPVESAGLRADCSPSEGANVLLVDLSEAALKDAVKDIGSNRVSYCVGDVTQPVRQRQVRSNRDRTLWRCRYVSRQRRN